MWRNPAASSQKILFTAVSRDQDQNVILSAAQLMEDGGESFHPSVQTINNSPSRAKTHVHADSFTCDAKE